MHTLPIVTPDLLSRALAAGGVGIWFFDPADGSAEWTERMAVLHDVSGGAGGRTDLFAHVEPEDRRGLDEAIAHAPSLSEPSTVLYRVRPEAGGQRWVSAVVSATDSGAGAEAITRTGATVVSVLASDITERKEHDLAAEERRTRIEGLHWVAKAAIAGQGIDDTAVALVEAASAVLGASIGVLVYAVPDDNGGSLQHAVTGVAGSTSLPSRAFDWPDASGSDLPLIVEATDAEAASDLLGRFGLPDQAVADVRSMILIPIGPGASLGAMCFTREDPGYFTDRDADLARSIGSTVAVAIHNAQRHEEQRVTAGTLQEHLLPTAPVDIAGAEVCTQYHPGRDGLDVGGDWFDVIDLGGRLGLAVGDVCGHGLAAAAHMGQLRFSFRALVQAATPAEEALHVLNGIALELGTTATVAYAEIDLASGACAVWRCGHLPPAVSDGDDGAVRWIGGLDEGGPMLGFLDRIDVAPIRTNIDRRDVLLLYTDGLVERRGEAIDDGLDRLARALTESLPVEVLDDRCAGLFDTLSVGAPDADDVAMVAVRRV